MRTGWMKTAGMSLLLGGAAVGAQVTSDTGVVNRIPKYSGAGSITNSAITEVNGSVGIGTASPQAMFDLTRYSGSGPIMSLGAGRYLPYVPVDLHIDGNPGPNGYNGLWISSGTSFNSSTAFAITVYPDNATSGGHYVDDASGNAGITVFGGGGRSKAFVFTPDTANGYMDFRVGPFQGTASALRIASNGNVGVGTTAPGAKLEVNGNLKVSGSGSSITFPDNSVQTTAYTGGSTGSGTANLPDITDANGKVGIGTTSPRGRLDIWGGDLTVTGADINGTAYIASQGGKAFYGNNFLGNGLAVDPNGNVGIGTANPQAALDVAGVINGRNYSFPSTFATASWAKIGTFTGGPSDTIRLTAFIHNGYNANNAQDSTYYITFKPSNQTSVDGNGFNGNGSWYAVGYNNTIPQGNIKWVANHPGTAATSFDLYIYLPTFAEGSHYAVTLDQGANWIHSGTLVSADPGPASSSVMIPPAEFDLPYGNVGIGTSGSSYKLEVNGNLRLSGGSGASVTFPDGSIQTVAWNGTLGGQDYADSVAVTGDRAAYEPGDVLFIDPDVDRAFHKGAEPYSHLVAGIYSTKPGLVGQRRLFIGATEPSEVPLAMAGIVPVKVSTENGPIRRGDLLVTSSTPGYAMRGTDRARMLGAVIGKAVGHLDSGTGLIEVVVALQ